MPIFLDNAFNPGDLDRGVTYPRAKIIHFDWSESGISMLIRYGDIISGSFVGGRMSPDESYQISITDRDYFTLVSTTGSQGVSVYDTISDTLYQWLIDNNHLSGTIE